MEEHKLRTCHRWITYRVFKSMVCSSDVANVEQLKEKVITTFATLKLQNDTLESVRRNLMRRVQLYMQQRERHFQQFF